MRTPPSGTDAGGVTAAGAVDGQSGDYWAQEDVTVTTSRPLTSFTVELRVARTAGVTGTGQYTTAPGNITAGHLVEGDYLVFRWVYEAGQTLAPGTYTFAGQFQHDPGERDASGDSFTITADGPGGTAAADGRL